MRYAVLFPGQGSQFVGMGADVFEARPDLLGSAAQEVLGWSLERLCIEGPEEELVKTDRAQPALYAVSYALWEAFAARAPVPPVAAAGHSLGEYTALAASGALEYRDGLRLVAERGRAMSSATHEKQGSMAAVMGAEEKEVESVLAGMRAEGFEIWVANVNAPGQVVVAGAVDAIADLTKSARGRGLRRVIGLNVAGAFHTPFMASAQQQLEKSLQTVEFSAGAFPVWTNLSAAPTQDHSSALAGQLVGQVRFSESLLAMSASGIEAFVHVGPGDVTAGMAKRTVKGATVITVSALDDIPEAVESLDV